MDNYTFRNIVEHYNFDEGMIAALHDAVVSFLRSNGIAIYFNRPVRNINHRLIRKIYQNSRVLSTDEEVYLITCVSDGASLYTAVIDESYCIYLHLFDLLHFGCGHLWQWNAKKGDGNFVFYGEHAWKTGKQAKAFAKPDVRKEIEAYEVEAGIISMKNLDIILRKGNFSEHFARAFKKFFCNFIEADKCALLLFCEDGRREPLYSFWTNSDCQEIPSGSIHVDFKITPTKKAKIQALFRY